MSGSLDAGLAVAAGRLVESSLGVVTGDRVIVVADESHRAIAMAISDAVAVVGAESRRFFLEELGRRPHGELHSSIAREVFGSQSSVLAIDFQPGELSMRTELVTLAERHGLRHGHMVGVSRESMVAGFSVDPHRIAEKSRALTARIRPSSRISVRSALGTELLLELTPQCRWIDFGNFVAPGKRVNLPGGELVTSPDAVNGVYVADGTLGDADGQLRRDLEKTPVKLRVAASRVVAVECAREPGLARAIEDRMKRYANLDRVGLMGFGLNLGFSKPMGDVFTDQKLPGVHLSLGETFPDKTGARWTSKSWIGLTARSVDADIDKIAVLRAGRYIV